MLISGACVMDASVSHKTLVNSKPISLDPDKILSKRNKEDNKNKKYVGKLYNN
jgi:hypothetical protein